MLVQVFELGDLWDAYGIVGDVVVCCCSPGNPVSLTYLIPQPFTNDFPRADISELLSLDILHQVIKGTFKDHLVQWINNYITKTNMKKEGNIILADIDRRYG